MTDAPVVCLQEVSRPDQEGGREETSHKEASKRLHALYEGDEGQSGGRVHAKRKRRHQPDPRPQGE